MDFCTAFPAPRASFPRLCLSLALPAILAAGVRAAGVLVVHPGPGDLGKVEHLKESDDYAVEVRKAGDTAYARAFVYKTDNHGGNLGASERRIQKSASFAAFSFSGTAVDVRITTRFAAKSVLVRPLDFGIHPALQGDVVTFTLAAPKKVSVEVNDRLNPLFLFADAPDLPDTKATYYFGPGVHDVGLQKVIRSGESVYIAGGAVVEGTFRIPSGSHNIRFAGRGVLSNGALPHTSNDVASLRKYSPFTGDGMTNLIDNVSWEGIAIVNSPAWVFAANGCFNQENHHNSWRNVKEVNWHGNTDGIWFDGHDNAVDDCFLFTNDDVVTTHGSKDCSIANVVAWGGSWGRIFYHGDYGSSSDLTFANIEVIGHDSGPTVILAAGDGGQAKVYENIVFRKMRIESHPFVDSYNANRFITLKANRNQIRSWRFENVTIDDKKGDEGDLLGSATGAVQGITFRNLKMGGTYVRSLAEAGMDANAYATGIAFESDPSSLSPRALAGTGLSARGFSFRDMQGRILPGLHADGRHAVLAPAAFPGP